MPARALPLAAALSLMLAVLLIAAPAQAAPVDPARCALTARATEDNDLRVAGDYRPKGTSIPLPRIVGRRVHTAVARAMARADPELFEGIACARLFAPVYRISGFGRRQLFVEEAHGAVGWVDFVLVLYDPVTGKATRQPPRVGSKWMDNFDPRDLLVKPPIISTSNLLGSSESDVVFQEQVHNGTLYNGVIYHHFEVGPHLSLTPVLALETRVSDPMDFHLRYVRTLRPLAPNRLQLDLFQTSNHRKRRALGHATLARDEPGKPFKVIVRYAKDKKRTAGLITFCDSSKDDDRFLRDGCDFYY